MGVRLTGRYPEAPSYEMGPGSFYRLRCFVAGCISKEFGSHYSKLARIVGGDELQEYEQVTERMLKKTHAKQRAVEFLYLPDSGGKLSPSKCKALLKLIGTNDTKELFGYTAYPEECMTAEQFKSLLRDCSEKKKDLVWR